MNLLLWNEKENHRKRQWDDTNAAKSVYAKAFPFLWLTTLQMQKQFPLSDNLMGVNSFIFLSFQI